MLNKLKALADSRQPDSLATKLRISRFGAFTSFIRTIPRPMRILDVGGTELFWQSMGFCDENDIEVVLLNLSPNTITRQNFKSVICDARDMSVFKDKEFDIVFSNSMIEHAGDINDQRRVAREIMRVGKEYYIQTPNRFFPIEPHFLFPFFQFFPVWLKVWFVMHFNMGWYEKFADRRAAEEAVKSIRLLSKKELRGLFPGGVIFEEKFFGMTKSFTVYNQR